MQSARRVAWVAPVALVLWLVYGSGYVGYDGAYSLVWGDQLLHAHAPDFEVPLAPTPHPLAILAGVPLSLFGDAALPLFQAAILISFAALGLVAFLLGRQLFSAWVGVLFAIVLLTRQLLVAEALQASIDIPFLLLVLWASLLEARQQRCGAPVLILLATAGLLRPEGWLLSVVYMAYLLPALSPRERWQLGALSVAAPALWAAFDLAITGDPLFSLHGTQDLAADLDRPRSLNTALETAPAYLKFILSEPVMWCGIAGALATLYGLYERALLPAALAGLGLVGFLLLGPFDLPLLVRYLLVPASMLALFCAVGVFGWRQLPSGGTGRYVWAAGAVALAAVLVASIPDDSRRIRNVEQWTDLHREIQSDLHDLVSTPEAEAAYRRCDHRMYVPNHRVVPSLAYWLGQPPSAFPLQPVLDGGLVLRPRTDAVAASLILSPREPRPPVGSPAGFRAVGANGSWVLSERCRG